MKKAWSRSDTGITFTNYSLLDGPFMVSLFFLFWMIGEKSVTIVACILSFFVLSKLQMPQGKNYDFVDFCIYKDVIFYNIKLY